MVEMRPILYHVGHYGFLPMFLVHKLTYHPSTPALFLLDQHFYAPGTAGFIKENLKRFQSYFGDIELYNDGIFSNLQDEATVEKKIVNVFDEILDKHHYKLSDFQGIYCGVDILGGFIVYLTIKRCKFTICDTGSRQILDGRYHSTDRKPFTQYNKVMRKYDALGVDNKYATEIIWKAGFHAEYPRKKNKIIDYNKLLLDLKAEHIEMLLNFFQVPAQIMENGKKVECDILVLSSGWFLWNYQLTPKDFFRAHVLLLDYYLNDHREYLLLKPHPNTDFAESKWLEEFSGRTGVVLPVCIPGFFPAELFPILPNLGIHSIVSAGSLGATALNAKQVDASIGYFAHFQNLHKLFIAYAIADICIDEKTNFHHRLEESFLRRFLDIVYSAYSDRRLRGINPNILNGNIFTVVDSCPPTEDHNICNGLRDASKNAVTVFLNSKNDFCFYDVAYPGLLDNMVPVRIQKRPLRDNVLDDLRDEYLYVFSKDPETRKKIQNFSMEKTLFYTGVELKVEQLDEKEIELIKLKIRLVTAEKVIAELMNWRERLKQC